MGLLCLPLPSLFLNTKIVKVGLFLIYIAFGSAVLENSPWDAMKLDNYCFAREVRSCPTLSSPLPDLQFIALTLPQTLGKWGQDRGWKALHLKTKLLNSVPPAGSVLHIKLTSSLNFS